MARIDFNNASCSKRISSFIIDSFCVNIFRLILQFIFITSTTIINYRESLEKFKVLFPKFNFMKLKGEQIYFLVNSGVYPLFVRTFIIFTFSGIIYYLLSYYFFQKTIGQKICDLRVTNMKDNNYPKFSNFILKSLFTTLPFIFLFYAIICQALFVMNFHNEAPRNKFLVRLLISLIKILNPYVILSIISLLILFWFCIFFVTNKYILSDILSRTRTIDENLLLEIYKNKKEDILSLKFGDKFLSKMENTNKKLKDLVRKTFSYIKSKFTRIKKEKN